MNFKEWLSYSGVKVVDAWKDEYENLDNIIGKQYWICDYRLNKEKNGKLTRNVTPRLVQVFSNNELPKNKNVYYSPIHFRAVKNGKTNSTVIGPFDNTGYRAYTGVSVNIFDNERDCRACFVNQCKIAADELLKKTEEINKQIAEIIAIAAENQMKP